MTKEKYETPKFEIIYFEDVIRTSGETHTPYEPASTTGYYNPVSTGFNLY